jgi:hypothetical protein
VPDPNFFGGDVVTPTARHEDKVEPWDHPFGIANQTDKGGTPAPTTARPASPT